MTGHTTSSSANLRPPPTTSDHLQWIMAAMAGCPASYYCIKMSILLFYLRVFPPTKKIRYTVYGLMAYCTVYYGIAFIATTTMCNLENRTWDITMQMNCFSYGDLSLTLGGMDLISDALILAFPIPMVWRLQLSWQKRVYLLCVFLCGIM